VTPGARVDRANPLPLWAQVLADLRAKMAGGEFRDRFPTDDELATAYGVSRQTVREAVRRLQGEGLVERSRGRGSTLATPVLEQPLRALYSLALTVSHHGLAEHNEILAAGRRTPPPDVVHALSLRNGEDAVFLERLRFADDEPLSLERSWLPWSAARGILRADLEHGPLYDALAERCGLRVTAGNERISPVVPPAGDRALLRMPARTAAFLVERVAFAGPRPVELRLATVRGDRYRFVAEWP
jgi:GntR family transcriptional regulator